MKRVYLGLGTNLGNREENLRQALEKIREFIGIVVTMSSVYETEPWGFRSENQFLNMVIEIETNLKPSGLLGRLLMIESLLGRLREGTGYKSRTIDIDILFYGQKLVNTQVLKVPHPLLHERKFVLAPLAEIAPGFVHPLFKKTIVQLITECKDRNIAKKTEIKLLE